MRRVSSAATDCRPRQALHSSRSRGRGIAQAVALSAAPNACTRLVDLVGADDERRHPAHARAVRAGVHQDQVALVEAVAADRRRRVPGRRTRCPPSARARGPGADRDRLRLQLAQCIGCSCSPRAHDVVEEAGLAHHLDRRQRRRAADRVAAVRAAVAALRPLVVELAAGAERREREARRRCPSPCR